MASQRTDLKIGKVIFVISKTSPTVVPVVVQEEHWQKIRKLDGTFSEIVNYKVCVGPKEKQQFIDLSEINGDVFESVEDVKSHLVERMQNFLQTLVKETEEKVYNWYGITNESQLMGPPHRSSENSSGFDPEQLVNGSSENYRQGPHPLQILNRQVQNEPNLRDQIKTMVSPDDSLDVFNQIQKPPTEFVIMPDGSQVPITNSK